MMTKIIYLDSAENRVDVSFQSAGKPDGMFPYAYHYVYAGERVILKFESTVAEMQTIQINGIKYLTDDSGVLYYDATDEVRANMGGSFSFINEDRQIVLVLSPLNGVNPESLLLPATVLKDATGVQIIPPSVIYTHERLSKLTGLNFEVRGLAVNNGWGLITNTTIVAMSVVSNRLSIGAEKAAEKFVGMQNEEERELTYNFTRLRECDNACVLNWLSASGVYKTAIWRVKQVKKTATSRELMPLRDEYLQQRGMDISFVAYIEGLNAYDYAYYADIITSGDVRCLMNEEDNLTSDESRVAVATDGYTAIDGNSGELRTLEVEIKYRHYDTI